MKVLFLYTSKGSADPIIDPLNLDWLNQDCGSHYDHYNGEGYFKMLEALLINKTITDLTVIFESNSAPGKAKFVKGAKNYVVPHISQVDQFVTPDTIIFVRGGFKHWHDWLLRYKGTNWLMCYAANTGREKWPWWDVVLDDLGMQNILDGHERYQFPFIKPIDPAIFHPTAVFPDFDICIGASHIHDKKGQWRAMRLLAYFYKIYGWYPKMVMPGSIRRSVETNKMLEMKIYQNECESPGFLNREDLAALFNRCKLFVHMGAGGQGDRSIAEAWACGCNVILLNPPRFSPLLNTRYPSVNIFDTNNKLGSWAYDINRILVKYKTMELQTIQLHKARNFSDFSNAMSFQDCVLPRMTELFKFMMRNQPTLQTKKMLPKIFEKYLNVINTWR